MAPVIAAALISAAATAAKSQADKRASASGGGNYQIDMKTPDSGSANSPSVKVDTYQPQNNNGSGNNMSWVVDTAANVANKAVNEYNKNKAEENKEETSDERLKNIFGDNEDIIKIFSKINAIEFKYNDKAQQIAGGEEKGIDNDLHLGIKAQDLEKSPLTESAVSEDANGNKIVDTKELTMANSAVISEICKRLEAIERVLGIKVV